MKKLVAVLLAVLMVFSVMAVSVYAAAPDDDPPPAVVAQDDEETTRNIQNEEGLVVPVNETQLKFSFMFKIVEKFVKFVLGIFGSDVDYTIADGIEKVGAWLDEVISNVSAGLDG